MQKVFKKFIVNLKVKIQEDIGVIFKTKLSDEEGFSQLYEKIVQLKLIAPDGKNRQTDCTDVETLLRIIQSVQSKKAEPYDIHKHHEFEFKE